MAEAAAAELAGSVEQTALRRVPDLNPKPTLMGAIRDALLAGEEVDVGAWAEELGYTTTQVRKAIQNLRTEGREIERVADGRYRLSKKKKRPAAKSPVVPDSSDLRTRDPNLSVTADVRRRLQAGEWLNAKQVATEYGVSHSLLGTVIKEAKKQGYDSRMSGRHWGNEARTRTFHQLIVDSVVPLPAPASGGDIIEVDPADKDVVVSPRRRTRVTPDAAPELGATLRVTALALERDDVVMRLEGLDGEWTAVLQSTTQRPAAPRLAAAVRVVALALEDDDVVVRLEDGDDVLTAVLRQGAGI